MCTFAVMVWNGCDSPVSMSQVQTEVLQKRQREKTHMMNAIKKYQKGQYVSPEDVGEQAAC